MPDRLAITRVSHACVLLEFGEDRVLTDPWFTIHRAFTEPPAITVAQLPKLTAIVGCHVVADHWNIDAMTAYAFKESTPVLVAASSMWKKARTAGFPLVAKAEWGTTRRVSDALSIEVLPGHKSPFFGTNINNYVFEAPTLRVFFGGETRDLEPLRRYRREHPGVDVFLGPVNGMRLLGRKLVMDAPDAIEAATILSAATIIPIHYAQRRLGPFGGPTSTDEDVERASAGPGRPRVVRLEPGRRWVHGFEA